jgi:hypothetical protein
MSSSVSTWLLTSLSMASAPMIDRLTLYKMAYSHLSGCDRRHIELIIGWAAAEGLLDPRLEWEQFRDIIRIRYYSDEPNFRRAGAAGGNMWRFIREMKTKDLVVVPHWSDFYVAEVTGPATYDSTKVEEDTAYRRTCRWLNDGEELCAFSTNFTHEDARYMAPTLATYFTR